MSNAEKAVDLLLSGEEAIAALVNLANNTTYVHTQLIIGSPRSSADENYNTDIEITFPTPPTAGDPDGSTVMGELHYNRLDLGRLFANKSISIRDAAIAHNSVNDLLAPLLEEARVTFDVTDFVDSAIPAGEYPKRIVIKAAPLSLRFVGQFSIELLEPIVDDTSIVALAQTETENGTLSQKALKTNGDMFYGNGNSAKNMSIATNGEIEIGGAVRLMNYDGAIPSVGNVYHVNIADMGDWTLPFSFALLDTRNADKITDLYDCTLKVTAPGGGILNFLLKRQYGKLSMVDVANQLIIDNKEAYNEAQTLYQELQRVTFYKNKLGSLSVNSVGSPYGTYQIELKATRKSGAFDPVVATFTAEIAGLPVA